MRNMTIPQVQKCVGTEFIYFFSSYDGEVSLPAVIAAFVPGKGFTCLATDLIDSNGYDHSDRVDKHGNLCLIGLQKETSYELMEAASLRCREIRDTGEYHSVKGGAASCSLS